MRMLVPFLAAALLLCIGAATASAAEVSVTAASPLAYQLARQPLALVYGNKCEIRGAVWAGGPRAGVNITLTSASGQVFKALTNKAGIYAVAVPFSGKPASYQERIADQVTAPQELAGKVHILSPQPIECSKERTAAFLHSTQRSAK